MGENMSELMHPRSDCDRYLFLKRCLLSAEHDSLAGVVLLSDKTIELVTQSVGPMERICDDVLSGVEEPMNRSRLCCQRDEANLAIKEVVEELRFNLRDRDELDRKNSMRQYGVVFKGDSNKYSPLYFHKDPISA